MPGLINSAPGAQPNAPTSPMVSPQDAQAAAKQRMAEVQKIVLAGQKVLYSPDPGKKLLAKLEPTPDSVGQLVAAVVSIVLSQVGLDKLNPDMIMPAGAILVSDVLDYVQKTMDVTVDEAMAKESIAAFINEMISATSGQGAEPPQPTEQMGV